ncbi:hypothetical protein AQUCO_11000026v1 [Aquilegia coerulea]|uniref:Smr domain-containing protein n=1 Tax=Aquilegia coerulea TaxID=218851 RepID=A0A2G5C2V9_AQUCA|nr:hypothetical protein AQUCO_11000026v1 [Aquilegia coerulea]
MALHPLSSSSSLNTHLCIENHPPSSSSSHLLHFNLSPFSWRTQTLFSFKLNSSYLPKASSIPSQQQQEEVVEEENSESPLSKKYVWVNPKSPRALKLHQQSQDVRYGSLIKYSQLLNTCNPTEEDVFEVLYGLGQTPSELDAVIVLNNMENPETAVLALKFFLKKSKKPIKKVTLYNVTMKVIRKCKNFDKAENLFEEMLRGGVKPDNITFTTIISCARMCYLPNKAVEYFEKMKEFDCKPDDVTYSAMIDAYGQAGNVDLALSLYDRARTEKWRIDMVAFATLIKIYSKVGDFDGALNVYEEMKALKVKPSLVVYNTLLDAMGRAKRPWQAKSIYRDMINNGLEPSYKTYAAILRAYCRSRYGKDALIVYREMKEKGIGLNNLVLYNSVLAMCADIGYVDEGFEIYEDMKRSEDCKPDSWTFSSLITMYSCTGKVLEAENVLNEMLEAGCEPNIFVFTSLIQCYGKANRVDDVVKTFNRLDQLGISPDDRFCGCLLNVMTQFPKEELGKLVECIQKANTKLGYMVTLLMEEEIADGMFKEKAKELFDTISKEARKAYCNCLIDLCVNLNHLDKACELLDLGLTLGIYAAIQYKSPNQWSLRLKTLSLGAAVTALHVWMSDLSKALENGEELPPILGIDTGHGKHKYVDKGLASVLESHLKDLNSPFHQDHDKDGWFLTTKVAAKSWLESRKSPELVAGY